MTTPLTGTLACLLLSVTLSAQSLFQRAVILDSLYDRVDDYPEEVPQVFFRELQGLYAGASVSDADIRRDFVDNQFLDKRVGNLYAQLRSNKGQSVDIRDSLLNREAELINEIVRVATRYGCKKGDTAPCLLLEDFNELRDGKDADVVNTIKDKISSQVGRNRLTAVQQELSAQQRRLFELEQTTENNLILSAAAGTSLPLAGGGGAQAYTSIVLPQAPKPAGSLQASVIDGASKWIAERMREELSIAFFDRFETWVSDQNIYVLFPNTFAALNSSVTTDYSLIIKILKEAFEKDLKKLPFQSVNFLTRELSDANLREGGFKTNDDLIRYLRLSVAAIEQLGQGKHPSTLLGSLGNEVEELFPESRRLKTALLVLDVLSRSLTEVDPNHNTVWISRDRLSRLSRDRQLRDFYFGLVYQELKQTQRREMLQNRAEFDEALIQRLAETGLGDTITETLAATRSDVDLTLYFNDLDFLTEAQWLESEGLPSTPWEDFDKELIVFVTENDADSLVALRAMGAFYDRVVNDEILRQFDSDKSDEWDAAVTEALDNYYGELEAVGVQFSLNEEELEVLEMAGDYGVELVSQQDNKNYDTEPSFREQIGREFEYYFEDEEITQALYDATERAFAPVIDVAVGKYEYIVPFYARMDRMRADVMREVDVIVAQDSTRRMNEFRQADPELRSYLSREHDLDNEQLFVNNLVLNDRQRFGNIINEFTQFTERIDYIQSEFKTLRDQDKANIGTPEFVYLIQNSMGLLDQVFKIALPEQIGKVDTIRALTDNVLGAYTAVLTEDYNAVVMNVIPVATSVLEMDFDRRLRGHSPRSDAYDELQGLKAEKMRRLQEVFRYGAFLAAVVESENSDQIKEAIRAIALPAGSYSIKRRSFANVSLNAYPGITGGAELIRVDGRSEWAPNVGFTAPIGLAFSWGYKSKIDAYKFNTNARYRRRVDKSPFLPNQRFLSGHSGSLFFPLIDLGAVVLFRLDGSTESLPEEVGFQQVFSPGVSYVHGLPNVPLAVMAGFQVSPKLRKFGEERLNAVRFNLGLTVDLPMANFYTRGKGR